MQSDELWQDLLTKSAELDATRRKILADHGREIVPLIKNSLAIPHEIGAAFDILSYLADVDRVLLLPELLKLAAAFHRYSDLASREILSLPRQDVLNQIEEVSRPILARGTEEEFGLLLALFRKLDESLALRLALQNSKSPNEIIRDVAAKFLSSAQ